LWAVEGLAVVVQVVQVVQVVWSTRTMLRFLRERIHGQLGLAVHLLQTMQ
jgi:hypothetical protein